MPHQLTRRHLLAGAAVTAACAAMPAAVAIGESIDFNDGRILWIFYERRREWIGIDLPRPRSSGHRIPPE